MTRRMWWVCPVHGRVCTAADEWTNANITAHREVGCHEDLKLRSGRHAPTRCTPEIDGSFPYCIDGDKPWPSYKAVLASRAAKKSGGAP